MPPVVRVKLTIVYYLRDATCRLRAEGRVRASSSVAMRLPPRCRAPPLPLRVSPVAVAHESFVIQTAAAAPSHSQGARPSVRRPSSSVTGRSRFRVNLNGEKALEKLGTRKMAKGRGGHCRSREGGTTRPSLPPSDPATAQVQVIAALRRSHGVRSLAGARARRGAGGEAGRGASNAGNGINVHQAYPPPPPLSEHRIPWPPPPNPPRRRPFFSLVLKCSPTCAPFSSSSPLASFRPPVCLSFRLSREHGEARGRRRRRRRQSRGSEPSRWRCE